MTLLATSIGAHSFVDIHVTWLAWVALLAVLGVMLLVDLLVVHRKPHIVRTREAAIESTVWISIGLAFGLVVFAVYGGAAGGEYLAGYLIEKSLSMDNVFVWAVIFSYFAVPQKYQHRVLFWGIFGALIMRAAFIFLGVTLIARFDWIMFVFGGFLLYTAVKLATQGEKETHPERNPVFRAIRKLVPSTDEYHEHHLFTRSSGRTLATPLFAVLVLIEITDVIFAVDSVPAVLAVSHEPFIVFSSNAFAILGLRALYFLLADMHARFSYLQEGLAVILGFVGLKMIAQRWFHLPTAFSLAVIAFILFVSIIASIRARPPEADRIEQVGEEAPPPQER